MALLLQQTLRGLCYDTGWCYAVFWKLKRQIRTVLTWEDGFYEQSKSPEISKLNPESTAVTAPLTSVLYSQQVNGGLENFEDPIGLAVAKMSYHVYSVGQGIIGRVAFTNKHQWIFGENEKGNLQYPAGWKNQFAAGIKTIAVIAVPQGVVQLGSTQTIPEDLNLVGHVKGVFGTLQNVPGAFLSDLVSEAQRGRVHGVNNAVAVSAPPMTTMGPPSTNTPVQELTRIPPVPAGSGDVVAKGLGAIGSNHFGNSGVGRLPMLMASQLLHSESQPSLSGVIGVQENPVALQQSLLHNLGSKVLVQPSFTASKHACNTAVPMNGIPLIADTLQTRNIEGFALTSKSTIEPSNISVAVSSCCDILPCKGESYSATIRDPLQNIQNFQPVSSITCSTTRLGNSEKKLPNQLDGQSQSNVSICCAKSDLSNRDSLVFHSGVSNFSQDSMQLSAMRSVGLNSPIGKHSWCQSKVCEPNVKDKDLSFASTPWSHSSEKTQSHLETDIVSNKQWNADNRQIDPQISDVIQLTEQLKDANKIDYEDDQPFEKICLEPKDTTGLLCEAAVESMQPLFEKSGSCFRGLFGKLDTQNASNSEQEEFDDFIALLSREQNKQSDCFSMQGSGFAAGDELSEALFPVLKKPASKDCFQDTSLQQNLDIPDIQGPRACTAKKENKSYKSSDFIVPFRNVSQGHVKPEPLLEAVVASVSNIQSKPLLCDKGISSKTGLLSLPSVLPEVWGKSSGSTLAGHIDGCSVIQVPSVFPPSNNEEVIALYDNANSNELQSGRCEKICMIESDSYPGFTNLDNNFSKMGSQTAAVLQEGKQNDLIKPGKKRARPGESGRPRPKDRQQIQDRVRELRDIIPNAAKCSIDALLERTIKYINDLQTVTQDADKWRQSSKLQTNSIDCNNLGPDGVEGDTSWAVELGVGCPIIVEKLKQPRQMLVEMLCEEKGIFLEIADSIRGLGLIILKGIMEARNNKIWARFVVEAVKEVHRLDVLCKLMHLLETNTRSLSDVTNPPCAWRATRH